MATDKTKTHLGSGYRYYNSKQLQGLQLSLFSTSLLIFSHFGESTNQKYSSKKRNIIHHLVILTKFSLSLRKIEKNFGSFYWEENHMYMLFPIDNVSRKFKLWRGALNH